MHHQWKPPRVDPDKCQVERIESIQREATSERKLSEKVGMKRPRRSLSDGSNSEILAPPRKRVIHQGEALLN